MGFVAVARLSDLPEGHGRRVRVGDEDIALWRVGGRIYAVGNVCPHQHSAVLHQAIRNGLEITCPMHGWTYSLETGTATVGSGRVQVYRVVVDGESVTVEEPGPR
jgi:nitrite reductase/ring-hydroxylating ferredoxin subunit